VLKGQEWSDTELVEFARRVYIATFDMDDSGSDSRSAYILLHALTRLKSPADLVWSRLIQLCLDASKRRLPIAKKDLQALMSRFIQDVEKEIETKAFFQIQNIGTVSAGKEIVLLENAEFGDDLLLFEIKRFDEHGQARVKFTNGKCVLKSGEYNLLHRTATIAGMERILQRNADKYSDKGLVIGPAKFEEDPERGNAARAHADWLKNTLQIASYPLNCLYCGRPVSVSRATVIEVDDMDHAPAVGIVHERCLQPMHRILGETRSEFFEENRHLIDFDVNLWVEKLKRGQALLAGLRESGSLNEIRVAWNPEPVESNRRYCIRFQLASGARPPALRRGRVQRFSLTKARSELANGLKLIEMAAQSGDPFCMTEDGRVFGPQSRLAKSFPEEVVSECISAEVVPYSREISEMYDQNASYYAPLIAVRVGEDEEYLSIGEACVLLSDILRVEQHFLNWASAGIIIPDYYLEIVADDESFDTLMHQNVAVGRIAVIDPLLSPNGNPISGISIVPLPSLSLND